jgi:N6-L-threonylcarbamoyladenine synthase
MNVLGIDTSCDDTSAAVVVGGQKVLSNVVNSQVSLHHPYGGVVPELASREHLRNLVPVVQEAFTRAGLEIEALEGIAVTIGPGLIGALLIGLSYAKALAYVHRLPLVGVNHLEGHILSIFLEREVPSFPFVAMTVSGGHTSLYEVKGIGDYVLLGQTLDDAAGEAFDKVAKILGLGYPGGPVIEKASHHGDGAAISFPRAHLAPDSLDFSFSGLKTAVSLYVKAWRENNRMDSQDKTLEDIAASFQEAVIDVLSDKLMAAQEKTRANAIVLAGGVACNGALKSRISELARLRGLPFYCPRPAYCTDNGAMIALAGHYRLIGGERGSLSMDVRSRFPIDELHKIAHRKLD